MKRLGWRYNKALNLTARFAPQVSAIALAAWLEKPRP